MGNKKLPDWEQEFELGMKDAFDKLPKQEDGNKNYVSGYNYALKILGIENEKGNNKN